MTTGILVVHTPAQAERTSTLCDMLELALSLPDDAIVCSSLPGYTLGNTTASVDVWNAAVNNAGAVIALVDEEALSRPQFLFELASAVCFNKWIVLLLEHAGLKQALPWQLARASAVLRDQRTALLSMLEDLAFQLDVAPRLGADVQAAIDQLAPEATAASGAATQALPPAPAPMAEPLFQPAQIDSAHQGAHHEAPHSVSQDEIIALDDDELQELPPNGLSCHLSLEAGRAISECSFHRESASNLSAELEEPFGRFVNAVGGDWEQLKRIEDVDVWLGATDNLLESLPPDARHVSDWFELGFQFTTLMSIAEQGLPHDPAQRQSVEQIWLQSMDQFQRSAQNAQLRHSDVHRLQSLLEDLINPEGHRDYSSIPTSLQTLRTYAARADT